jgi:DNA invertase Pin-like site-specific DNA recombinase
MDAVIYARLSQDRNGESTSTERQVRDCEAFAAAKGWQIVGRYVDADLSAYSAGTVRPQYERMLEEVDAGRAGAIVGWKLDRLLRRPRELEKLLELCERSGARVATLQDGIDTSTNFGEVMPRMLSIFAEMESKNISIRQRSKAAELAAAGRHHGGGTRPYGLSAGWSHVIESEAQVLRDAAARILRGESLRGVALDLNRRGITTSKGGQWKPETLRQTLVSPRVAGLRKHHGEIVGRGGYPAILDEATYQRVAAMLRHGAGRGPQARKYLLSGFARCHACDRPMVGHKQATRETYICQSQPRGCGRTKIGAEPLEARVTDLVLAYLDSPALAAALDAHERKAETVDLDALRADESALEELSRDYYTERMITRGEYLAARDILEGRIKAARGKMARTNGTGPLRALLGADLRDAWEHEPLDWRRSVLAAVVDRIVIGPAVRGRNAFDPARVSIEWRY